MILTMIHNQFPSRQWRQWIDARASSRRRSPVPPPRVHNSGLPRPGPTNRQLTASYSSHHIREMAKQDSNIELDLTDVHTTFNSDPQC